MEKPILIRNFLSPLLLNKIRQILEGAKTGPDVLHDSKTFHRNFIHNNPLIDLIHTELIAKEAPRIFGEKLKPSYSFASFYTEGKGICPLHTDREQCYRTIDICINQKKEWPLYINHVDKLPDQLSAEQEQLIKERSVAYVLQPGDAICYSGTDHPHWRNQIDEDNTSDLVFFHFVPEDFEGSLY